VVHASVVHHYRVELSGPLSAVAKELAEIGRPGVGPTFVVAREEGIEYWEAMSRRHPRVTFGIECFAAYEDELLHAVVQNGETTIMARTGVLPSDWGSFHDEDGEPIDDALLREAADRVFRQRLRFDTGRHGSGLATALTFGKALGRLCCRLEETACADRPGDALDAVVELAVLALWTSTCGSSVDSAERDFQHALRTTQSMVHAGRSEFRWQADELDWSEWLRWLIGSTSEVIDAATHVVLERETELHALGAEHYGTPTEQLEVAARSLLTICIEALALFGDAKATAV